MKVGTCVEEPYVPALTAVLSKDTVTVSVAPLTVLRPVPPAIVIASPLSTV